MAREQTWVTDPRHLIDEETDDWGDLPGPALNLAIALGSIVAWVTDHLPAGEPHTNVPCWRSPGRKRCRGDITPVSFGERNSHDELGLSHANCLHRHAHLQFLAQRLEDGGQVVHAGIAARREHPVKALRRHLGL